MTPPGSLATDLYQLTMAAAFWSAGRTGTRATFEYFVRSLPANRDRLLVAGLAPVLDYLEALRFSKDDIEFLRGLPAFSGVDEGFFKFLKKLRFTGSVHAMREGTVAAAGEPIVQVTGPLIEAQLVESTLLALMNHQTIIATKAARIVAAARADGRHRSVAEFGLRRAHGPEAGIAGSRAAYIGGCSSTATVEAGRRYGIPVVGTAAHSFIMSFDREDDAFRSFARTFPNGTMLLIDTYDIAHGAKLAAAIPNCTGVRIDSGDLAAETKRVRAILDAAGRRDMKIVLSNDLNEDKIKSLLDAGAPVDIFGVGTELIVSKDAPALGGVYKLVETEDGGVVSLRMKKSAGKATLPGRKQVWRATGSPDLLALATEPPVRGREPLLVEVMRDGARTAPDEPLASVRERAMAQWRGPVPSVALSAALSRAFEGGGSPRG